MSHITLPRAAAEKLEKLVAVRENIDKFWKDNDYAALAALAALATALAEPEPTVKDSLTVDAKREPVAHVENGVLVRSALPKGYTGPLYAAPPEPPAIARAVEAEREACAKIVYGLCVSDNNAQEIVNAIRARGSK